MSKKDLKALQIALAVEHATIYGYGVVGARTSGPARVTAASWWRSHRTRRDQLVASIVELGGRPVASEAAYPLPDAADPAALAAMLENRLIQAYVPLAGAADPQFRRFAAQAMQEAMTRAVRWTRSGPGQPFPGLAQGQLAPSSRS